MNRDELEFTLLNGQMCKQICDYINEDMVGKYVEIFRDKPTVGKLTMRESFFGTSMYKFEAPTMWCYVFPYDRIRILEEEEVIIWRITNE
jgi:hypothetical protein